MISNYSSNFSDSSKALIRVYGDNKKMLISKKFLSRFFAIVDRQTSFTLCYGVGDFVKVGVKKFGS